MTIQQHNPPHPGELIKRTYIDPFDEISGNQIAKRLGVAVSTCQRQIEMSAFLPSRNVRFIPFFPCYKVVHRSSLAGLPIGMSLQG